MIKVLKSALWISFLGFNFILVSSRSFIVAGPQSKNRPPYVSIFQSRRAIPFSSLIQLIQKHQKYFEALLQKDPQRVDRRLGAMIPTNPAMPRQQMMQQFIQLLENKPQTIGLLVALKSVRTALGSRGLAEIIAAVPEIRSDLNPQSPIVRGAFEILDKAKQREGKSLVSNTDQISRNEKLLRMHLLILKEPDLIPYVLSQVLTENFGDGRSRSSNRYFVKQILNTELLPNVALRDFLFTGNLPEIISVPKHLNSYVTFLKTQFQSAYNLTQIIDGNSKLFYELLDTYPHTISQAILRVRQQEPEKFKKLILNRTAAVVHLLKNDTIRNVLGFETVRDMLSSVPETTSVIILDAISNPSLNKYLEFCNQSLGIIGKSDATLR